MILVSCVLLTSYPVVRVCVRVCPREQAALDIKAAADASRSTKVMCWKGHSMGCYLLLNIVDRLRWKGEDLRELFGRVILDAPDVPTWFFSSITKVHRGRSTTLSSFLHFSVIFILSALTVGAQVVYFVILS